MNRVTRQIGRHNCHTGIMVLEVPKGTLAARDKSMVRCWMNQFHGQVKDTEQVWQEVYAQACEDWLARPENEGVTEVKPLTAVFYIVKEGDRVSSGCIDHSREKGVYYLTN